MSTGLGQPTHRVIMVTGASGAGRTTAVRALEDAGFEAIDNLPLSLLPRLLDGPAIGRPLALGVDVRNRDFSAAALLEAVERYSRDPSVQMELMFLDCRSDVLVRRYSETRRRHPLAPETAPSEGIDHEIEILRPVRDRADLLIDTSEMTPHDLKAEVERWYADKDARKMSVMIQSFSYKRGVPRGVDMVFDCRFLRNPHWEPALRSLDGRDQAVRAYVEDDARYSQFFESLTAMVETLLPAFAEEGKSHLSIGFGCTGGQHRSVCIAENLANALAASDWQVSKRHRELDG